MSDLYAPNQQVVRGDGSGPAEEGDGGTSATPKPGPESSPPPEPEPTAKPAGKPEPKAKDPKGK